MALKSLLLFCISIISLSCIKQKANQYEIDCNYETKLAKNDFKYQNYTYTNFMGFGFGINAEKEFSDLLKENKIKYESATESCIIDKNTPFERCYPKEMNLLLENKYGKPFFDSLKVLGIKQFVLKNKDSIFSFEVCDLTSRTTKTNDDREQFDRLQKDYFTRFNYPKSYVKRQGDESHSNTTTHFVIMKDGTAKDFTTESSLVNTKNNIFEKSFNKSVENYVKSLNWKPALIKGIPVNSYMNVTIFYD
ncbi:hypothetical protein CMU59_06665 [Elizabethkingia anophelis]|uniref:hypothetical protein n=1 Tax=Elizabethkingia anophelis TaxID=1117645 RepID=UPI002012C717|nr:hypothetical protein [Elizabethkingia anophelis]MCL1689310.1 hypothetical protein [Elizabethkingia anophelis]MDV3574486.1 hypothetical protein [Elizabethkingia anophelis]MDV3598000.1 hypothetical protein [Elizabethkingia anophelis]MDV3607516.1 hypothetical protein [Elizabethkingia anophelis]MDV3638327.1 hypothetical protein [Elizabethkingia anophelis]